MIDLPTPAALVDRGILERNCTRMADRATARDVLRVYDSLSCGSRNHMRAFCRQLRAIGAEYEAQCISATELEEILASEHERCGRRRR